MNPIEECHVALDAAQRVVDQVDRVDLGKGTPCADWDVRALVTHMIWMCDLFAKGLSGVEQGDVTQPDDLTAGDSGAAFRRASAAAMDAWRAGPWDDKLLVLPFATMPATIARRIFIGDQLIHTWDLATALGRTCTMDETLAAQQLEMMQQYYNAESRGPDRPFDLATDCADGATTQDRLIALSGRNP